MNLPIREMTNMRHTEISNRHAKRAKSTGVRIAMINRLLKRWKRLSRDRRNTIIDGILLVTLGFTTYAIVYYGMIIGVALWPAK